MTTVGEVVNDVIRELSQVPGQATQIYSTPRMTQHVQDAVLMELEEIWWPHLIFYQQTAVDPDTGIPVDDLGPSVGLPFVDDFTSIYAVWLEGAKKPLPSLPLGTNPFTLVGQSNRLYIGPSAAVPHRPLKVWPPAANNIVVGLYKQPTLPMTLDDDILLDRLLITYDACWMYAVDDGTIPAQVNKFQTMAVNRRKQMIAATNQHASLLDDRVGTIPNQWMEAWC